MKTRAASTYLAIRAWLRGILPASCSRPKNEEEISKWHTGTGSWYRASDLRLLCICTLCYWRLKRWHIALMVIPRTKAKMQKLSSVGSSETLYSRSSGKLYLEKQARHRSVWRSIFDGHRFMIASKIHDGSASYRLRVHTEIDTGYVEQERPSNKEKIDLSNAVIRNRWCFQLPKFNRLKMRANRRTAKAQYLPLEIFTVWLMTDSFETKRIFDNRSLEGGNTECVK